MLTIFEDFDVTFKPKFLYPYRSLPWVHCMYRAFRFQENLKLSTEI